MILTMYFANTWIECTFAELSWLSCHLFSFYFVLSFCEKRIRFVIVALYFVHLFKIKHV